MAQEQKPKSSEYYEGMVFMSPELREAINKGLVSNAKLDPEWQKKLQQQPQSSERKK